MNLWDRELADTLEAEQVRRNTGTCQIRGCIRKGRGGAGKWRLCNHHRPLWQAHNRVLDRILAIPPRP